LITSVVVTVVNSYEPNRSLCDVPGAQDVTLRPICPPAPSKLCPAYRPSSVALGLLCPLDYELKSEFLLIARIGQWQLVRAGKRFTACCVHEKIRNGSCFSNSINNSVWAISSKSCICASEANDASRVAKRVDKKFFASAVGLIATNYHLGVPSPSSRR
jgi:hypothetical protein